MILFDIFPKIEYYFGCNLGKSPARLVQLWLLEHLPGPEAEDGKKGVHFFMRGKGYEKPVLSKQGNIRDITFKHHKTQCSLWGAGDDWDDDKCGDD